MRHRSGALRTLLAGALTAAALVVTAGTAAAVPPPPPNPTDGQLTDAAAQLAAANAEVGRLAALVATAESQLEQYALQAEAAGTAYEAAEEALTQAQADADQTAAALQVAADAVAAAEARIADFSRNSYIDGHTLSGAEALLTSSGPTELIQRAATLDWVADNQVDVLGQLQQARVQQADADSAARAARDQRAAAEAAAEAAKAAADTQLAAQQTATVQVQAQKTAYEQQLQAAQIHLLELQGARDAYSQWVAQKQAEEAAAAAAEAAAQQAAAKGAAAARVTGAGYVLPAAGRTSSCFGARWGVSHLGMDIAAPIGTPIYAATTGVVRRAGPATGFGLAVYIQGDDGAVTVYGHVNRYFVTAGQRVSAGDQIAEVGNRGQSTGPHLHFEVHPDGAMYSGAVNPGPWLRARGVAISGC